MRVIAGHWRDMTLSSGIAAVAFAVYALRRQIRGRRFERECRPLIERLESLLRTMEFDRI